MEEGSTKGPSGGGDAVDAEDMDTAHADTTKKPQQRVLPLLNEDDSGIGIHLDSSPSTSANSHISEGTNPESSCDPPVSDIDVTNAEHKGECAPGIVINDKDKTNVAGDSATTCLGGGDIADTSNQPSSSTLSLCSPMEQNVDMCANVDAVDRVGDLSLSGAADGCEEDDLMVGSSVSSTCDRPMVTVVDKHSGDLDSDDDSQPSDDNIVSLSSITSVEVVKPSTSGSPSSLGMSGANPSPSVTKSGGSGSPGGCKRSTMEDKSSSPRAKRQTPDRLDESDDGTSPRAGAATQSSDNNPTLEEEIQSTAAKPIDDDLSSLTSSSEEEEEVGLPASSSHIQTFLRRRRQQRRREKRRNQRTPDSNDYGSDSSSSASEELADTLDGDENNSDDGPGDEEEVNEEEVKHDVDRVMHKSQPKPKWFFVPELKKREYGCRGRESLCGFNQRLHASLEMLKRLHLVNELKYHEGCVNALSFNRIGTLLASGSDDLNIVLWNWQSGRPALIYDSGHRSNVFQAKFLPYSGDCHVVSCARDGQVRLAELSLTGVCKRTRKLANHRGSAHKLALEMDSPNNFLSCGEDAVTFLVDLREDKPHRLVTTKESEKKVPLYSIHSNPSNPHQFCVGGRDSFIRVYDKRRIAEDVNGGVYKKLCPHHLVNSDIKANVTCACYNYNGTEILGTYNDEDIYLFDNTMSDGADFTHRYTGHRNNATVKGVNFYGPGSEFIVSGSDCGHVYFWDKHTEAIVNFKPGDTAGVINVLEPHPLLPVLATSGLDHEVKMWMPDPRSRKMDGGELKQTVLSNAVARHKERHSAPEVVGGQMLWFLMHHFRSSARRRMRAEGMNVSSSDSNHDSESEDEEANREMQCAQS